VAERTVHERRQFGRRFDAAGRDFVIGKSIELVEGSAVTLIATGLLVAESIRAAETLDSEGISARVIDMHTIKPLDREAIARAARETGAIVVAEGSDGRIGLVFSPLTYKVAVAFFTGCDLLKSLFGCGKGNLW